MWKHLENLGRNVNAALESRPDATNEQFVGILDRIAALWKERDRHDGGENKKQLDHKVESGNTSVKETRSFEPQHTHACNKTSDLRRP